MRTSETDPIFVAWLPTALPGRIGLTFAPGKVAPSALGPGWARDLDADLDRLRALGVDLLAPLIEDHELDQLRIPALQAQAERRGIAVVRLPIPDGGTPGLADAQALTARIVAHARGGGTAVVHCRGGLGRAGTLASCALVALGHDAEEAMRIVRSVRPGAIENVDQERFVRGFSPGGPLVTEDR